MFSCDENNFEDYFKRNLIQRDKDQEQTIQLLNDSLKSVQNRFDANRKDIETLVRLYSQKEKESKSKLEDIYNENGHLIQENQRLTKLVEKLNQQNRSQQSQLQKNKQNSNDLEDKKSQINSLEQQNDGLKKQAHSLKRKKEPHTVVLRVCHDENESRTPTVHTRRQLEDARRELLELRKQVLKYEQNIAIYEEQTVHYSHNFDELQNQITELEKIIKAKDRELADLNQQKSSWVTAVPSLHDEVTAHEAYTALKNQYVELEQKYASLHQNYLKLECKQIVEQQKYKQAIVDLTALNAKLTAVNKQHEDDKVNLDQQNKAMAAQLQIREHDLQQHIEKVQKLQVAQQAKSDENAKKHQQEITTLSNAYKALQSASIKSIKRLQQEVETNEAKRRKLDQTVQHQRQIILDSDRERIVLREQVLQHEKTLADKESLITTITSFNTQLTATNKQHVDDKVELDQQNKATVAKFQSREYDLQQHIEKVQKLQVAQQAKSDENTKKHQQEITTLKNAYQTSQTTSLEFIKHLQHEAQITKEAQKQLLINYQIKLQELEKITRARINDRQDFYNQHLNNNLSHREQMKKEQMQNQQKYKGLHNNLTLLLKEHLQINNLMINHQSSGRSDKLDNQNHLEIAYLKSKLQKLLYENNYFRKIISDLYTHIQELNTKIFDLEKDSVMREFIPYTKSKSLWGYYLYQFNTKFPHISWMMPQA